MTLIQNYLLHMHDVYCFLENFAEVKNLICSAKLGNNTFFLNLRGWTSFRNNLNVFPPSLPQIIVDCRTEKEVNVNVWKNVSVATFVVSVKNLLKIIGFVLIFKNNHLKTVRLNNIYEIPIFNFFNHLSAFYSITLIKPS